MTLPNWVNRLLTFFAPEASPISHASLRYWLMQEHRALVDREPGRLTLGRIPRATELIDLTNAVRSDKVTFGG